MTNRITNKDLERAIEHLNEITGNQVAAYTKQKDGKLKANIGTYILDGAYGGVRLDQITSHGGAVSIISTQGYTTKRNLYNEIQAIIFGIELEQKRSN